MTPGLLPKKLNTTCLKPFKSKEEFPNMNIEVLDSGKGELMMESLLDYVHQTNCLTTVKPDFVTNKQLLVVIAGSGPAVIFAYQRNGIIFILKYTEEQTSTINKGGVFEHFCTKTRDEEQLEPDETVRKAVFTAEIPRGNGDTFKVMYSGQIDAIDDEGLFRGTVWVVLGYCSITVALQWRITVVVARADH